MFVPYKDPEDAKEWARRYYLENREKKKAQARAWYAANTDRAAANRRAYAKAHPEVILKARQQYYERYPGLPAERAAAWYAANKERAKETRSNWQQKNREKHLALLREKEDRRKARIRAQFVEEIDRWEVFKRAEGRCGICGDYVSPTSFETDHVQPLCAGGAHSYANTQLAHPACNRFKGNCWPWPASPLPAFL